ncbi:MULTISPECIES: ribbon-helix-helix domain-containing protein [unclassified Sphingomonas]|uniref:ribbon-helix-helix domain-containing protein n=1 Tax=unclassified Sphingomonas TaxID=196159 RepID=UPI0007001BD3|nr:MULTISPECIES: ribbon-helix-helix domain-containing protein [unclassified Sphingomonas]KQX19081.1 arylsulfate sulfotransferase [Sphingomonas sp. Root1294]KQY65282.1 arylsulfate sulfotransferase [Sphingomonas sp. Root50]KRB95423.1 arylsulfate sulfotransferase [Sphingomonas sp. Root720]
MVGPVKRSVNIAGHATSITLEPVFWEALVRAADEEGLPLNALVARIDVERIAGDDLPNLASAIRVWLFRRSQAVVEALRNGSDFPCYPPAVD